MGFFQTNIFVLLDQTYCKHIVKYIKLFKIQAVGCYDINVTFISSPKDSLLEQIPARFQLFLYLKKRW